MARISQVLLDKLPSGGPSAQWGRMYAVLMEEPCLCEVLSGAVLDDDGTVRVAGVDGLAESTARLECLYAALRELQRHHKLYQERPAVQSVLATMSSILEHRTQRTVEEEAATAAAAAARAEDAAVEATDEDGPEITYLVPKDPKIPRADEGALRRVRTSAVLEDDLDVRFFPHLFPRWHRRVAEQLPKLRAIRPKAASGKGSAIRSIARLHHVAFGDADEEALVQQR